jgi:hypothetical protein
LGTDVARGDRIREREGTGRARVAASDRSGAGEDDSPTFSGVPLPRAGTLVILHAREPLSVALRIKMR